jgi:hypothetical protein
MEKSLENIADAIRKKLPRHLRQTSSAGVPAHDVVITAFVDGQSKIYTIGLVVDADGKEKGFRYSRFITGRKSAHGDISPRFALGGSGAFQLWPLRDWGRELIRIIHAHDSGKIKPQTAAEQFAQINSQVANKDEKVGKRCIVVWRKKGGGGFFFFSGLERDPNREKASIPFIITGTDLNAVMNVTITHAMEMFKAMRKGEKKELDGDLINQELAKLPDHPDETLD